MKTTTKIVKSVVPIIGVFLTALWLPSSVFAQSYLESGDFAQGAKSWADNCSRCHNIRDPQDLRDDQWVTSVFHMRVRAGLTGQQARDIVTFLQGSNDRIQVEEPSARTETSPASRQTLGFGETDPTVETYLSGEEVYDQTCIACHGGSGQGTVPGAPNLSDPNGPLSKTDEVLFQHIIGGYKSEGSPMAMPAKGGNSTLTERDIRAVMHYMRKSFNN